MNSFFMWKIKKILPLMYESWYSMIECIKYWLEKEKIIWNLNYWRKGGERGGRKYVPVLWKKKERVRVSYIVIVETRKEKKQWTRAIVFFKMIFKRGGEAQKIARWPSAFIYFFSRDGTGRYRLIVPYFQQERKIENKVLIFVFLLFVLIVL